MNLSQALNQDDVFEEDGDIGYENDSDFDANKLDELNEPMRTLVLEEDVTFVETN